MTKRIVCECECCGEEYELDGYGKSDAETEKALIVLPKDSRFRACPICAQALAEDVALSSVN